MSPDLIDALRACDRPTPEAHCLPPACYASADVLPVEADRIFATGWIGLGRADAVAAPGDYLTCDIAGHSLILTRTADGTLAALGNHCRHRGARLVDGAGQCKGFRCPFHSWFYALDGRLVSAPQMQAAAGFYRADHGLARYPVQERMGFAFVCLAGGDPPDLDAQLGDFAALHADWPMADLRIARRRVLEVDCNWKLFLDVFNEYYHLPFVHADSIDSLYNAPDPGDRVTGAFATQFGATEGTGGLLEGDQDQALPPMPGLTGDATRGARYTWVFPNMTFAANSDGLWCYEAYPLGPDRCRVVQTSCFHTETMAHPDFDTRSQAYLARMDAALDEDVAALINQQRGMQSIGARAGRFQPDLEPNVAGFARWYSQRMLAEV